MPTVAAVEYLQFLLTKFGLICAPDRNLPSLDPHCHLQGKDTHQWPDLQDEDTKLDYEFSLRWDLQL